MHSGLQCGSPSAHNPSQTLGQTHIIVLRPCSMQMRPPRAQLSLRSTANDSTIDARNRLPAPLWLWQVPCSTPGPDDKAGDLDGDHRPPCTTKPRVTTLSLVSGQVAEGAERPPLAATLASPRDRRAGVGPARARSRVCTWYEWMVGLFSEPGVVHSPNQELGQGYLAQKLGWYYHHRVRGQ